MPNTFDISELSKYELGGKRYNPRALGARLVAALGAAEGHRWSEVAADAYIYRAKRGGWRHYKNVKICSYARLNLKAPGKGQNGDVVFLYGYFK